MGDGQAHIASVAAVEEANQTPEPTQTTGCQQNSSSPTPKTSVEPARAAPNSLSTTDNPKRLEFLRPQGSIYCQNESILPQAVSRFKTEETLGSSKLGIASLQDLYQATVDRHSDLKNLLTNTDTSGEPLKKALADLISSSPSRESKDAIVTSPLLRL